MLNLFFDLFPNFVNDTRFNILSSFTKGFVSVNLYLSDQKQFNQAMSKSL